MLMILNNGTWAAGALLLIGGGGLLLSKIDPQFNDFIGAGALKVGIFWAASAPAHCNVLASICTVPLHYPKEGSTVPLQTSQSCTIVCRTLALVLEQAMSKLLGSSKMEPSLALRKAVRKGVASLARAPRAPSRNKQTKAEARFAGCQLALSC